MATAVRRRAVAARTVRRCLRGPRLTALAESLLAAESVAVDDLNERRAVANVLRSYAATDGFLPPPTLREYVLWAADGTRAYASEANGEVCYATAVVRNK